MTPRCQMYVIGASGLTISPPLRIGPPFGASCCSSVVERVIGNDEVGSSILPSSTIAYPYCESASCGKSITPPTAWVRCGWCLLFPRAHNPAICQFQAILGSANKFLNALARNVDHVKITFCISCDIVAHSELAVLVPKPSEAFSDRAILSNKGNT